METVRKKRLHTDYEPLSLAVSLEVATPNSGVGQVYDPNENSYAPDREITPLVIVPMVRANTVEGSWSQFIANPLLSEMKWFVNGVNITSLSEWTGKYSINNDGIDKGSISILKNVESGRLIQLHFESIIPDERTGINIPIVSDTINLTTVDKADDTWAISIDAEPDIIYNPFLDKLLMYDYKLANNMNAGNRKDALDSNAYARSINILVTKGGKEITNGYTNHLYKVTGQTLTEITNEIEVVGKTNSKIDFDLRFIEKRDYMIITKSEGVEVARTQFSITRHYPKYDLEILSGVSIRHNQTIHRNKVSVSHNANVIELPAPLIRMIWYTDTQSITGKEWQEGESCLIEILRSGIGKTYLDSWMDIYIKSEQKKAFDVYDYQDNNGNIYIGN